MDSGTITVILGGLGGFLTVAGGLYLKVRADGREERRWRAEEEERREKRAREIKEAQQQFEEEQRQRVQQERERTDRQMDDLVGLLSEELGGARARISEIEGRHDKLREDHEAMVLAVGRNQETIHDLEGELDRLRVENDQKDREIARLTAQVVELTARLAKYEQGNGNGGHT